MDKLDKDSPLWRAWLGWSRDNKGKPESAFDLWYAFSAGWNLHSRAAPTEEIPDPPGWYFSSENISDE